MKKTVHVSDFDSTVLPTWCPGCGNFAIFTALKNALVELNLSPTDINLCFDIGCNGNGADKINAYAIKGLHGRAIATASGVHLGNHKLPVISMSGDGGTLDEGIHHLIHAIRSNYNITFLLHNNGDFGLTTGQATPTTPKGSIMNSSPYGVVEERLNPVQIALTAGATFVAKGHTGNIKQLQNIIKAGIKHNGFSFIEILQTCPSYNKIQDIKYLNANTYDVATDKNFQNTREYAYKSSDYSEAKIPTGILYEDKKSIAYYDRLEHRKNKKTVLKDEVKKVKIDDLLVEFY